MGTGSGPRNRLVNGDVQNNKSTCAIYLKGFDWNIFSIFIVQAPSCNGYRFGADHAHIVFGATL